MKPRSDEFFPGAKFPVALVVRESLRNPEATHVTSVVDTWRIRFSVVCSDKRDVEDTGKFV